MDAFGEKIVRKNLHWKNVSTYRLSASANFAMINTFKINRKSVDLGQTRGTSIKGGET